MCVFLGVSESVSVIKRVCCAVRERERGEREREREREKERDRERQREGVEMVPFGFWLIKFINRSTDQPINRSSEQKALTHRRRYALLIAYSRSD